jgi:uncharacterized protein YhfF
MNRFQALLVGLACLANAGCAPHVIASHSDEAQGHVTVSDRLKTGESMTRFVLIADGPAMPDDAELDRFWDRARAAHSDLGDDHQVRSLGIDAETTETILEFIRAGSKVATFSLPWVLQANGFPEPVAGMPLLLTDYRGKPRMVVRLTDVRETTFGAIGPQETSMDGPPVQDPDVWIPLHREYWNGLLSNYGRRCTDDMPVLVEPFEFVYDEH